MIYAENQEGIQLLDFYDINETETSGFQRVDSLELKGIFRIFYQILLEPNKTTGRLCRSI